jgi:putative transposase
MDYRKQGHSVYYTRYHLVVATKYRREILRDGFGEYPKKLVTAIDRQVPEVEIIEIDTDVDHVHILLSVLPKMSVSEVVKELKAKTGLYMRKKFTFLEKVYWAKGGIWSRGYFSAVAMKQGVVKIGRYYTGWVEYSDQQNRQKSSQPAHQPGGIWEEPMISIVSFLCGWVCGWQDAGDGMFCGAEHPSGYEIEKDFCRENCHYWGKVLNYGIPCRSNSCIHANLPVLFLFSIKTSEGWYVCVDKSLKSAA